MCLFSGYISRSCPGHYISQVATRSCSYSYQRCYFHVVFTSISYVVDMAVGPPTAKNYSNSCRECIFNSHSYQFLRFPFSRNALSSALTFPSLPTDPSFFLIIFSGIVSGHPLHRSCGKLSNSSRRNGLESTL